MLLYVVNVRIYFHFHRQVMELKECQAYGHISAPNQASHEVPPATIESKGVYDNIWPCRYDNMIIIIAAPCKRLSKRIFKSIFMLFFFIVFQDVRL